MVASSRTGGGGDRAPPYPVPGWTGGDMRAIVVREFGQPEVMKLEQAAEPTPGRGEVLVRAGAIGVNPVDTYVRAGNYASLPGLPYTPGADAAGEVAALGEGVDDLAVGQ